MWTGWIGKWLDSVIWIDYSGLWIDSGENWSDCWRNWINPPRFWTITYSTLNALADKACVLEDKTYEVDDEFLGGR
ncbi:hypothetical protein EQV77_08770 [Halobacillus fulvus]|nr:hypothetical protein EQV77_08770 [Halobacillus fulvus]